MLTLFFAVLAVSSGVSTVMMLAFVVREARNGHFPPRTALDGKVSLYAGLLVSTLSALSLVAKDAAFPVDQAHETSTVHERLR